MGDLSGFKGFSLFSKNSLFTNNFLVYPHACIISSNPLGYNAFAVFKDKDQCGYWENNV